MEKRKPGRPPGSSNRPKTVTDDNLNPVEAKIAGRMDKIVDKMIELAEAGDVKVGQYLINRVLGRPTEKSEVTTKGEQKITVEYVENWRDQ